MKIDINVFLHGNDDELFAKIAQTIDAKIAPIVTELATLLTNQGALMSKIDDLTQNLQDITDLVAQILQVIADGDAEKVALRQQVADLLAGDAAMAAKVDAAFQKSEDAENALRAAVPGVPPVGGTPLNPSYPDRGAFDTAVAAYTGPERVTLDGSDVKGGTDPSIDYFTHSVDGRIDTTGPTD